MRRLYGSNLAAAGRGHELLNDPLPVGAVLDALARGDDLETQFAGSVDDEAWSRSFILPLVLRHSLQDLRSTCSGLGSDVLECLVPNPLSQPSKGRLTLQNVHKR